MVSFIDEHREGFGVEPICNVLPIAQSTYYEQKARQADPSRLPVRARQDAVLRKEVRRVWNENRQFYGARKVWHQMSKRSFCAVFPRLFLSGKTVRTSFSVLTLFRGGPHARTPTHN